MSQDSQPALKREWSWNTAPILVPLAFETREWNAVYIAGFLAEYSGASMAAVHIKTGTENLARVQEFKEGLDQFARQLRIKYTLEEVPSLKESLGVTDVASMLVQKSVEYGCQAVVMSAQREAFFRELFGRVSDHVARNAPCKVVLVETPWAGLSIPKNPSRILVPILKDKVDPEPLILSAALTSSASVPDVEIIVGRVVELHPTMPLDEISESETLKRMEREFSIEVSVGIRTLGRLLSPRIIPVREVGTEVASYAKEIEADLMVLISDRPSFLGGLLPKEEYEIVRRAPCIVVVVFPSRAA